MSLKKIILALTLSLGLIFLNCENRSSKNAKLLEPIEYKTFLFENDVLLVDLRTPKEFNSGHLENAINVNFLSSEFIFVWRLVDSERRGIFGLRPPPIPCVMVEQSPG